MLRLTIENENEEREGRTVPERVRESEKETKHQPATNDSGKLRTTHPNIDKFSFTDSGFAGCILDSNGLQKLGGA